MTAADRREELEALLWREIKPPPVRGIPEEAVRRVVRRLVEDILVAADAYATERLADLTVDELRGRLRLAELAAENQRADAGRARKRTA